ncbi:MAG: hypothetical protein HBSAPP03_07180 [Phycisphaerae bacterium]|nr:MAG: hypothetical protein HBSAPP03_07180 [Phycisphaerae bacterium]
MNEGRRALHVLAEELHAAFDRVDAGASRADDVGVDAWVNGAEMNGARLAGMGMDLGALLRMGILETVKGGVRARVLFERCEGVLIGRHRETQGLGKPESADGIGVNARALSRMIPRGAIGSALDLGCGQGFHALRASRHARRVVGTDVSRVALHLAWINAVINGAFNVEFRRGSVYEPVEGMTFDLIMANTPFVFSPVHTVTSTGAAAAGDAVCGAIVRGAGARLNEGGYGVFICNWEHRAGARWDATPRAWVEGTGVDAWIVHLGQSSVTRVMEAWFTKRAGPNAENEVGCVEALRRWRAHVAREGVEALSLGMIFVRKRAGATWVRCDEDVLAEGDAPGGVQVRRVFENTMHLEGARASWLESRLSAVDAEVVGEDGQGRVLLWQVAGFRMPLVVERDVLGFLRLFDGARRAREVLRAYRARTGMPLSRCEAVTQELMRSGYLEAGVCG